MWKLETKERSLGEKGWSLDNSAEEQLRKKKGTGSDKREKKIKEKYLFESKNTEIKGYYNASSKRMASDDASNGLVQQSRKIMIVTRERQS